MKIAIRSITKHGEAISKIIPTMKSVGQKNGADDEDAETQE